MLGTKVLKRKKGSDEDQRGSGVNGVDLRGFQKAVCDFGVIPGTHGRGGRNIRVERTIEMEIHGASCSPRLPRTWSLCSGEIGQVTAGVFQ